MTSTVIDDQDFIHVTYTGTWVKGGTPHELDGTVASSTNVGDSCTVSFNGDSIKVFGTIDSTSGGVVSSYSIDSGSAQQATSPAGSGDTYNQLFWASPTLTPGNHVLKVTMVHVNDNSQTGPGEGTIWFDYFLVDVPPTSETTSSSSAAPTSSSSSISFPTTTNQSGALSSLSSTQTSASPQNTGVQTSNFVIRKSHTAAIVGGILGAIIGLLLLAALAYVLFRRRKERKNVAPVDEDEKYRHPDLILDGASD